MAKLTVNIGTSANDRTGDNLRTAFNKINTNFTELYTELGLDDNSLNLITNIISKEKLSPFHTFSSCCDNHSCLKVFINKSNNQLLKENEIDVLFSQLIEAGFKIEYEMSKLINEKNFICFISKN